jgi:hypothetical protein
MKKESKKIPKFRSEDDLSRGKSKRGIIYL